MEKEFRNTIHCPYCNWEYLVSEILYPETLIGKEESIERDVLGQIVYYEGTSPNHFETYICDHCNKQFKVVTNLKFAIYKDEQNNLNSNYFTMKPSKLFLKEEN